jgi:hypothetical protein
VYEYIFSKNPKISMHCSEYKKIDMFFFYIKNMDTKFKFLQQQKPRLIAQLAERSPSKGEVMGSIPIKSLIFVFFIKILSKYIKDFFVN